MFVAADEIITKNPQILQKTTDEIFDELDDGTEEMIHNRWGVMVRARMQKLKSLAYLDIIDFLLSIKEKNYTMI